MTAVNGISLRNEQLRVTCVPGHGALVTEIVPLAHGTNLLWRRRNGPLHDFAEPAVVAAGRDPFDDEVFAGGWFGMFPAAGIVGPEDAPEQLHGTFPRYAWRVRERTEVLLRCALVAEGLSAERTLRIAGASVLLSTTVRNVGASPREVGFGEHPCFDRAAFAGGEVSLIAERGFLTQEVSEPGAHRFRPGQRFDWPFVVERGGGLGRADAIPATADGTHDHLCIALAAPEVAIAAPPLGGRVVVRADIAKTPYLLFWRHFRPPASPWGGDVFGIETMSTPGRTRADARAADGLTTLPPGGVLRWELEVRWEPCPESGMTGRRAALHYG